jgi:hypothetical protein
MIFIEHCKPGDDICWESPPWVRTLAESQRAPSASATYVFVIRGVAFARFKIAEGKVSEPMAVNLGQPCEVVPKRIVL